MAQFPTQINANGLWTLKKVKRNLQGDNWPTFPGAPTIGTATAGNAQASVTFTAPAANGGSAVTSYRVTSSPGNISATGSSSPITVTGLTNGTAYTFTVRAINTQGAGPASAASNSVTPVAFTPTVLAEIYNTSNSTNSTGNITIPSGTARIAVFACAGGGSGGYTQTTDNGSGAGGGGAASISGFEINVSAGDVIAYVVGAGGTPVSSSSTANGGTGGNTTLTRSGTTLLSLGGGGGGGTNGGGGGSGGSVSVGTGQNGGSGGSGGQRSGSPGANGSSVTNGCGGGGGGGAHVSNKTGGTGGSSVITVGTFTYSPVTISFTGGGGGSPGTPASDGDAPPQNIELARGGYGRTVDGNTGAGGGAGRGIRPTVNGVAATNFHGAGGGGNRSYVDAVTTAYDGRGAGGFLIVVSVA